MVKRNFHKNISYTRVTKERFLKSTIHGASGLVKTNRKSFKIMWIICFLVSTSLGFYLIVKSVKEYLNFEVVTQIRVLYEISSDFPAIYVCNINVLSTNASIEFGKEVLKQNRIDEPFTKDIVQIGDLTDKIIDYRFLIATNIHKLSDEEKRKMSLSYNEIFISAFYNGNPLFSSDFEWRYFVDFGSCFIFNLNQTSNKKSLRSGTLNGLTLELKVPEITDPYAFSISRGINIFVTNASYSPTTPEGVILRAGTLTDIMVSREITKKLEKPYSDCTNNLTTLDSYDSYLYKAIIKMRRKYYQQDCFDLCYQRQCAKVCGCVESELIQFQGYPYCTSPNELICESNLLKTFSWNNGLDTCMTECPLECETTNYPLTLSTAEYPTRPYAELLINYTNISNLFPTQAPLTYETLKNSILKVNLFYDELEYTFVEELEKTSIIDLLAGIGGTLGLCAGMSILSFVELVELIFEIIFIYFTNKFSNSAHDQFISLWI
jgi:hypothetical protein